MITVYTIGYGGRTLSEFISILKDNGVNIVIDVRRFPRSSNLDFTRENLERSLRENGIEYVFLGDSLGGFVRGGYEKYMETDRFKEGFNKLIEIAGRGTVALVCREKKFEYCHRRFIAQRLEASGIRVKHI